MELYDAIKGRRSIRKFKPDSVPKELIEKVLEMAMWAPSGMNQQNWHFIVVAGEKKDELVEICSRSFEFIEPALQEVFKSKPKIIEITHQFFKRLGGAPVVIFAYRRPGKDYAESERLSVAAAIHNLCLAAYGEGLGTCWMTGPLYVAEAINRALGVTDTELIGVIPIGYPDQTPPTPPRKEGRVTWIGL